MHEAWGMEENMFKLTKIFPVICLLIVTLLTILYYDIDIKYKYTNFTNYELTGIRIDPDNEIVNVETVKKIADLANQNDIILMKEFNDNGIINIFLSYDNISDVLPILNLPNKTTNSVNNNDIFIATYISKDVNQAYYIPDFLNNNKYKYSNFDALINQQGYYYGDFSLYYKSTDNLNSFMNSMEVILGTPRTNFELPLWGRLTGHSDFILLTILFSILLSVLLFFIFQIFQLFKKSKSIGCMRLLGFSISAISSKFVTTDLKLLIPSSFIIIITSCLVCKNITVSIFISIVLLNILIILLNAITKYCCVKLIISHYNLSNILKKEALASKISKFAICIKTLISLSFLIFILILFPQVYDTYQDVKYLENLDYMSEFAIFSRMNIENNEWDNNDKYLKFSTLISQDKEIQLLYADFSSYYMMLSEDELLTINQMEKDGSLYRFATVDSNYLKKYDLYPENDAKVQSSLNSNEYIMFPKSKQNIVDKFIKFYKNEYGDLYTKYNLSIDLQYYFYEDKELPTFDSTGKVNNVEAPIIRVVPLNNYPISYNEASIGIDVGGTGASTKLKFDIQNGKKEVFDKLEKHIKSAELNDVLIIDNFTSYAELYNDEFNRLEKNVFIFLTGIIISSIIYMQIIFQTFYMLLASKITAVRVKQLLGFRKRDLLIEIISYSIFSSAIPALCVLVYYMFNNSNFIMNIMIVFLFAMFEIFTNLIMAIFIDFNKINLGLKGENYD